MLEPSPDVYEAVKGLRVVRHFEDRQLTDEHLDAIAPLEGRFVTVSLDPGLGRLDDVVDERAHAHPDVFEFG